MMILVGALFCLGIVKCQASGSYDYKGKYQDRCYEDGLYYMDTMSFVLCAGKNAYQQPCAPGTRNAPYADYEAGHAYGFTDFCTINLNDYGYVPSYDPHGTYGGYHVDRHQDRSYQSNYNRYTDEQYGVRHRHARDHSLSTDTYHSDGYGAERDGYGADRDGYGAERDGYGAERDGYGAERDGYGAERDRYGYQESSYGGDYGKDSHYGDNGYGRASHYHDNKDNYHNDREDSYGRTSSYQDNRPHGVTYEKEYEQKESYSKKRDGYGEEKTKKSYGKRKSKKIVHLH